MAALLRSLSALRACALRVPVPQGARAFSATARCLKLEPDRHQTYGRVAAHGKERRAFFLQAKGKPYEVPPAGSLPYGRDDLPFVVRRTANKNLPVYSEKSQAEGRIRTVVRNIDGNAEALKAIMVRDFKLLPDDVTVRFATLKVNGHHVLELKQYLSRLGF